MIRKMATVELKSGFFGQLQQALGISVIDNWFDTTSFANLADAIASIGLEESTLVISQVIDIGQATLDIPLNITLQFLQGGSLQLQPAQTVIIHGEIQAGLYQIFYGNGNIKCGVKNGEVYPQWWGAAGDGSTNDQEAIQSAIDALDAPSVKSGTVLIPRGKYLVDGGINIPVSIKGLMIKGAGRSEDINQGTWLFQAGNCPLFTTKGAPTDYFLFATVENISFQHQSGASTTSHMFDIVNPTVFLDIHDVYFRLTDPNSSFLKMSGGDFAHLSVRDLQGFMAYDPDPPKNPDANAKVPAIEIDAQPGHGLFALSFENIVINSSLGATAPIFKLDGGSGGANASVKFQNITLEVPAGGGIELRSIQYAVLENVVSADIFAPDHPTTPTILIGESSPSPGVLGSREIILIGCGFFVGTLKDEVQNIPLIPDVKVEPKSNQPNAPFSLGPVIIGSRIGVLESQSVPPVILGSRREIINLVGTTTPLWLPRSGNIQGVHGISATAKEPRNLRGAITVLGGSNQSLPYTFAIPEENDEYFLTLTPVLQKGTPNIGATRITEVEKTSTGFTIHVESDPSDGAPPPADDHSVTFDWHLIR